MTRFGRWLREPQLPAPSALAPWLDKALVLALALLGFFLPWAPAGVSVALALLTLLALPAAPVLWRSAPWRDPVVAAGLLLLAYIAVHTLLTSGPTPSSGRTINRYHELIMVAVLLAMFRVVSRPQPFFGALVIGAVGYAVAHWVALVVPSLADDLASRRISAGLCLSITAFVLVDAARSAPQPRYHRLVAAFLAATVLFAIDGRTGHLVLLLLGMYGAWVFAPTRWRWPAVAGVTALIVVLALASGAVQNRLTETLAGASRAADGSITSTAIRLELLRTGLDLSATYWPAGAGFARYREVNEASVTRRYGPEPVRQQAPWAVADNPHSEYAMQLVGGGFVALALFLAWLVVPALRRRAGNAQPALAGLSLAFAVGCLFNSSLRDFVEGHFHAGLLAFLLAARVAGPAHTQGAA